MATTADPRAFWEFERAGWQKVAGRYEECWSSLTRLFVEPLLAAAGVGPGTRLLDVACGPGYAAEAARRRGAVAVALDFSLPMVRQARRRLPGLPLSEADAESLPVAAARFDAAVSNFGVPHFARPERAFAEARWALRSGGRFAFTTWAPPADNPGLRLIDELLTAHADLSVPLPKGPPVFRFADPEECRRALAAAGFDPGSLSSRLHPVLWRVPTATFFLEAERFAGVRTAGVLARQTTAALAAIEAGMRSRIGRFATADGYAIPMAAWIVAVAV